MLWGSSVTSSPVSSIVTTQRSPRPKIHLAGRTKVAYRPLTSRRDVKSRTNPRVPGTGAEGDEALGVPDTGAWWASARQVEEVEPGGTPPSTTPPCTAMSISLPAKASSLPFCLERRALRRGRCGGPTGAPPPAPPGAPRTSASRGGPLDERVVLGVDKMATADLERASADRRRRATSREPAPVARPAAACVASTAALAASSTYLLSFCAIGVNKRGENEDETKRNCDPQA